MRFGFSNVDHWDSDGLMQNVDGSLDKTGPLDQDSILDSLRLFDSQTAQDTETYEGGFDLSQKDDSALVPFCEQPHFYCSDFNATLDEWQPSDEETPAGYINAQAADFGGVFNEYWSPDLGDGDRALTVYKSSNTNICRWQRTFLNSTGKTIIALNGSFDLEVPFVRFQGAEPASGQYNIREAVVEWVFNGPGAVNKKSSPSVRLQNTLVKETDRVKWLKDGQMDALNLRVAKQTFSFSGLSVASGQSFTLYMGRDSTASGLEKNMNFGVDNLLLQVTTSP